MAIILKFEDPEIWQKSRLLSQKTYPITFTKTICEDHRYKHQLRGSVNSIMANITECCELDSKLEFINSLTIAKGEVDKCKSHIYRGLDNQYLSKEKCND